MVMSESVPTSRKSKKPHIFIGLAIIFLALIIGVLLLINSNKKDTNEQAGNEEKGITYQEFLEKARAEQTAKVFNDSVTQAQDGLMANEKYDEVISQAENHCKTLTGVTQATCFSNYAMALILKKDFTKAAEVVIEILKLEIVVSDPTATANWQAYYDNLVKGIDPTTVVKPKTEEEIRQ